MRCSSLVADITFNNIRKLPPQILSRLRSYMKKKKCYGLVPPSGTGGDGSGGIQLASFLGKLPDLNKRMSLSVSGAVYGDSGVKPISVVIVIE